MIYCSSCGAEMPDGANVCPCCKAVQSGSGNLYSKIENTPHDTVFAEYKPSDGVNLIGDAEAQSFYFQQKSIESVRDASNGKSFGIVSIICAIVFPLVLISWIFGAVGLAKAKSAADFAQQTGNLALLNDANSARSLNKTGLIIAAIVTFCGLGIYLLVKLGLIALISIF